LPISNGRTSQSKQSRIATRLLEKIESLYEWPLRFPVADLESMARGIEVRKMSFGNYIVTYRVDESAKTVEVLSFRHGAELIDGP